MDENQTAAAAELDPFGRLLEREGAWEQVDGLRLRQVQTGEAFGRLPLPTGEDTAAWEALVAALADLDSDRLVPPRAVIDHGAGLLYDAPDGIGGSFARVLESEGSIDHRETMRMAADLAAAVTDLHACGAVLSRLRLQDVLRGDDGGWVLLVSPASGARVAGLQRARQEAADVVLLASAVVTVLTGRRPSAQCGRPPLRSTHPQLDPGAADALDRVLDDDGGGLSASDLERVLRGDRDRLGDGARSDGSDVLPPPEDGATETLPAVGAGAGIGVGAGLGTGMGAGPAPRARRGLSGGLDPDDDGSGDIPVARRRGGFSSSGVSWRPVEPDPRRTRWVLLGAAAMVLGAAALAGWQLMAGTEGEGEPAVAAGRASSGASDRAPALPGPDTPGSDIPGLDTADPDGTGEPGEAEASSGSGGAEAAVSAQHSPEYAAAALIGHRAEALRTGDRQLLESVYVAGAADLADDLATLDQADGTEAFADLEMTLMGAAPVSGPRGGAGGAEADAGVGGDPSASPVASATVTGTVEATGMAPAPGEDDSALHQDLEIRLEVGESGGWQIVDVTPL